MEHAVLRELREHNYTGGYTILTEWLRPQRGTRGRGAALRDSARASKRKSIGGIWARSELDGEEQKSARRICNMEVPARQQRPKRGSCGDVQVRALREAEVTQNERIATEEIRRCFLCGSVGRILYERLRDWLFEAPGEWGFLKCPDCGLVWLNPRPIQDDLGEIYRGYYTRGGNAHSTLRQKSERALYSTLPGYSSLAPNWFWNLLGRGLSLSSLMKERALLGTMCLVGNEKGRLLDVGCGNGFFLSIMRDAGWQVVGVEPDREAAHGAQQRYGVTVLAGYLADAKFDEQTFDAITLNHVIEHVFDPVAVLSECRRLLKPNGRIVVVTPNVESEGHSIFKSFWRGLEHPRHIHLFSRRSLQSCCEQAGLSVELLRTSERSAAGIWVSSQVVRGQRNNFHVRAKAGMKLSGVLFQLHERKLLRRFESAGEELVTVANHRRISTNAMPTR